MSDTQKHKKPNVPNLRFPEFSGELIIKRIDEIAPLQRGFDLPSQSICVGDVPVVYSNGIMNYHNESKCFGPGIITGRSGTIGKLTYIEKGPYWPHNTSLWVTDFKGNYPKYVYYLYEHINLSRFSSGSGVPTLNRNDVHAFTIGIPKGKEQKRIADFLSILDKRIEIQNKVIEDYATLEKVIQNRLFAQLSSNTVPLSKIAQRINRRNTNLSSCNVLTISARDGLVSQLDFFKKSVASENLTNYYLLSKGDFAYNKSYSSDYPWGAIKHLELYDHGVLSPLYICFKANQELVDLDYLQFYFETSLWFKHISDISVEGARNHGLLNMSISDFFDMPICLPNLDYQRKIAGILKVFKHKKEAEQVILDCFQIQKRFLLNQIFV